MRVTGWSGLPRLIRCACAISLICLLLSTVSAEPDEDLNEYEQESGVEDSGPVEKRGYNHALRIRRGGGAMHALRIRKSSPSNFALRIRRAGRQSSFQHALRIKKSPSNFALRIKKDPEPIATVAAEPAYDDSYDESDYAEPHYYYAPGYAKRAEVGRRAASLHTLRIKKSANTGWNGSSRGLFWLNSANLAGLSSPSLSSRDNVLSKYQHYAPDPSYLKSHINRDRKSSSFSHVLRV